MNYILYFPVIYLIVTAVTKALAENCMGQDISCYVNYQVEMHTN